MKEQCLNCKYWQDLWPNRLEGNPIDGEGTCRRYPAVFVQSDEHDVMMAAQEAGQWMQPVMYASGWCGEFQVVKP